MVYIIHIKKEMITIRLWHYKLLPVLPDKMLVSQWRECIAIKRQWEKGTLKHRLVSYVMKRGVNVFYQYFDNVKSEMDNRGIKYQAKFVQEFISFGKKDPFIFLAVSVRYPEHNDRYLKQCLYNLQEKADRDIITQEEWQKIEDKFESYLK